MKSHTYKLWERVTALVLSACMLVPTPMFAQETDPNPDQTAEQQPVSQQEQPAEEPTPEPQVTVQPEEAAPEPPEEAPQEVEDTTIAPSEQEEAVETESAEPEETAPVQEEEQQKEAEEEQEEAQQEEEQEEKEKTRAAQTFDLSNEAMFGTVSTLSVDGTSITNGGEFNVADGNSFTLGLSFNLNDSSQTFQPDDKFTYTVPSILQLPDGTRNIYMPGSGIQLAGTYTVTGNVITFQFTDLFLNQRDKKTSITLDGVVSVAEGTQPGEAIPLTLPGLVATLHNRSNNGLVVTRSYTYDADSNTGSVKLHFTLEIVSSQENTNVVVKSRIPAMYGRGYTNFQFTKEGNATDPTNRFQDRQPWNGEVQIDIASMPRGSKVTCTYDLTPQKRYIDNFEPGSPSTLTKLKYSDGAWLIWKSDQYRPETRTDSYIEFSPVSAAEHGSWNAKTRKVTWYMGATTGPYDEVRVYIAANTFNGNPERAVNMDVPDSTPIKITKDGVFWRTITYGDIKDASTGYTLPSDYPGANNLYVLSYEAGLEPGTVIPTDPDQALTASNRFGFASMSSFGDMYFTKTVTDIVENDNTIAIEGTPRTSVTGYDETDNTLT